MKHYEYPITDGYTLKGQKYKICRRSKGMVEAGAAPFIVYLDEKFYCTCETMAEAREEINAIDRKEV